MSDVIFAQPRHVYESYADLRSLIALSGFPLVYYDEIDPDSDNTYVLTVLNGECEAGWKDPRARIVLWDLEYHLDGVSVPGVAEVWSADAWYARQIDAKYAPMGSHPGLRLQADSTSPERYDVAFLGYMIPRRERIYNDLKQAGVKVSPPHAWGEERHRILANSTAYLHIHQHEHIPTIAPLRMVVAAAYGLCVISESVADAGIFEGALLTADYSQLSDWYVKEILSRPILMGDLRHALHWTLCENLTFRKSVEAAL